MTDAELLEASKRGERAAFGALVERYQRMVSAVSYSRTRDQALSEDVAQDTFIAAWRQLDQLREPGRLRSWLCGIARNLASKARRRTDREVFADPELLASDNPFDAVCEAQAQHVVREALSRVPDSYRDVLVLYYREQLTVRQVADTLAISEAAALQRLSRGRQHLASGVTSLVESALRSQRPKRNLVVSVLAALPPVALVAPSRVEASTSSHGGNMFKFAFAAAAAFVAIGTTAFVATRTSDPSQASAAAVIEPTAMATPHNARSQRLRPPAKRVPAPGAPSAPSADNGSVAEDADRVIDAASVERLGLHRGPGRGPADAPVTITMFTDLQCPYCEKAQAALDELFELYPNKLRLVVKQMPVHRTAELGAEAAYAADAQGKFKELNELMIANHDDLSRESILALARQAALDVPKLRDALDSHAFAAAVDEDLATAEALEFRGTPAFVINGRRIVGSQSTDAFRRMIDDSLKD